MKFIKILDNNRGVTFNGDPPYIHWFDGPKSTDLWHYLRLIVAGPRDLTISMPENPVFGFYQTTGEYDEVCGVQWDNLSKLENRDYTIASQGVPQFIITSTGSDDVNSCFLTNMGSSEDIEVYYNGNIFAGDIIYPTVGVPLTLTFKTKKFYEGTNPTEHWLQNVQIGANNLHWNCTITSTDMNAITFQMIPTTGGLLKIEIGPEGNAYKHLHISTETVSDPGAHSEEYIHQIFILANYNVAGEYIEDITINNEPFKIGIELFDQNETLNINATNMGIEIPEHVVKAFYSSDVFEDKFDWILINNKWRELLLNYMDIWANKGSYKSLYNSLKWFGYGDLVELREVWKHNTEAGQKLSDKPVKEWLVDELKEQLNEYSKTTYYTLRHLIRDLNMPIDYEYGSPYDAPELEGIGQVPVYKELTYNGIDSICKWGLDEMRLKMTLLGSFFETYFMPVHLDLLWSTVEDVFFNISGCYHGNGYTIKSEINHQYFNDFGIKPASTDKYDFRSTFSISIPAITLSGDKYVLGDSIAFDCEFNGATGSISLIDNYDGDWEFGSDVLTFKGKIPGEYEYILTLKDEADNTFTKKINIVVENNFYIDADFYKIVKKADANPDINLSSDESDIQIPDELHDIPYLYFPTYAVRDGKNLDVNDYPNSYLRCYFECADINTLNDVMKTGPKFIQSGRVNSYMYSTYGGYGKVDVSGLKVTLYIPMGQYNNWVESELNKHIHNGAGINELAETFVVFRNLCDIEKMESNETILDIYPVIIIPVIVINDEINGTQIRCTFNEFKNQIELRTVKILSKPFNVEIFGDNDIQPTGNTFNPFKQIINVGDDLQLDNIVVGLSTLHLNYTIDGENRLASINLPRVIGTDMENKAIVKYKFINFDGDTENIDIFKQIEKYAKYFNYMRCYSLNICVPTIDGDRYTTVAINKYPIVILSDGTNDIKSVVENSPEVLRYITENIPEYLREKSNIYARLIAAFDADGAIDTNVSGDTKIAVNTVLRLE